MNGHPSPPPGRAQIGFNFTLNMFEAQYRPDPESHTADILSIANSILTIAFGVELAVNMFSTLFWEFVRDSWNWFDSVVVLVRLTSALTFVLVLDRGPVWTSRWCV